MSYDMGDADFDGYRILSPNLSTRCRFCLNWRAIDKDGEGGE
jgi:hypothetical protein